MPDKTSHPVWRSEDARQVFERAMAARAASCPHRLVRRGETFHCDNPNPAHDIHTSMALRAEWVNTRDHETPYYEGTP